MRLDFAALWNVPPLAIARVASGLLRHCCALMLLRSKMATPATKNDVKNISDKLDKDFI